MEYITISKATTDDVAILQRIGKQTFHETFAADNTEENMDAYMEKQFSLPQLIAELSDQNTEFHFALLADQVIGYLKLNSGPSQTELKNDTALEIERIYVLAAFHGQKVGQALYEKALEVARKKSAPFIWLGVWEKNQRAIRFYAKNGFTVFDKHIFTLGNDEQTDIMMKKNLNNDDEHSDPAHPGA